MVVVDHHRHGAGLLGRAGLHLPSEVKAIVMGVPPNGLEWKIPSRNGGYLGVPIFWETIIYIYMCVCDHIGL